MKRLIIVIQFLSGTFFNSGKASDIDHFKPEIIDHLGPVVCVCNQVDFVYDNQVGQMWKRLLAFAPGSMNQYQLTEMSNKSELF